MAQSLNVALNFTANTAAAQANIDGLNRTLSQMSSGSREIFGSATTQQIQQASLAAQELQAHLAKATDLNTGKINLGAFNNSLASANTSVQELSQSLLNGGKVGSTAFVQLQNALTQADTSMMSLVSHSQLGQRFIQSFMGAIANSLVQKGLGTITNKFSQAMSYAQKLNSSLNSIQIVTGLSAEQMSDFAVSANKAAQSLSASTTAYTDAALIYYQQGLRSEEDIQGRTNTTIKMANITGQSAATVSEQLTAIWNNFDDYGDEFERYADIITALGATTASSSAEIAEGLGKFAAIANTVGLSYNYATSALATLVAATRQSADTVGTSLKTIFSRLQGLSLGETLDDGVDLNKYSTALNKVGVQVLDASGNMREMDDILDDLASKWDTLTKAQQMALAQTVAGVRQYTTLISLMENWDKMEVNVSTAENAEGTVDEQEAIYEKSWAAAKTRAKTAWQEIYDTVIDDDFFIGMTDLTTQLTSSFGAVFKTLTDIDNTDTFKNLASSIGESNLELSTAVKMLPVIGVLVNSILGKGMAKLLDGVFNGISNKIFGVEKLVKQVQDLGDQSIKANEARYGKESELTTYVNNGQKNTTNLSAYYASMKNKLTPDQVQKGDQLIGDVSASQQRLLEIADGVEKCTRNIEIAKSQYQGMVDLIAGSGADIQETFNVYKDGISEISTAEENASKAWEDGFANMQSDADIGNFKESLQIYIDSIKGAFNGNIEGVFGEDANNILNQMDAGLKNGTMSVDELKAHFESFQSVVSAPVEGFDLDGRLSSAKNQLNMVQSEAENVTQAFNKIGSGDTNTDALTAGLKQYMEQVTNCTYGTNEFKTVMDNLGESRGQAAFQQLFADLESGTATVDKLKADFQDFYAQFNGGTQAPFQSLEQTYEKLQAIGTTIGRTSEASRNFRQQLSGEGTTVEGTPMASQQIKNQLTAYLEEVAQAKIGTEKFSVAVREAFGEEGGAQFEKLAKDAQQAGIEIETIEKDFTKFYSTTSAATKTGKDGNYVAGPIQSLISDAEKSASAAGVEGAAYDELVASLKNVAAEAIKTAAQKEKLAQKEAELAEKAALAAAEMEKMSTIKPISLGQGITSALGGVSSLAMGLTSLKTAWDSLQDEDATLFEQITTVSMSLGMAVTSIAGGFNQLGTLAQGLASSMITAATREEVYNAALLKNRVLNQQAAKTAAEAAAATLMQSTATGEAFATEQAATTTKIQEALANTKLVTSEQAVAIAKKMAAGATYEEAVSSTLSFKASLKEAGAKAVTTVQQIALNIVKKDGIALTLTEIALAAGLVAAIGLIAYVIYKAVQAWNNYTTSTEQADEQLAEAKTLVDELTTAYENATNAVEELQSAQDNWKSAEDTLAGLVEGTTEWKEALLDVNQEVLNLIDKYPALAQYLKVGENGKLEFSDGYEDIIQKGLDNALTVQANTAAALTAAKNIKSDKQIQDDFFNKYFENSDSGTTTIVKYVNIADKTGENALSQEEYDLLDAQQKEYYTATSFVNDKVANTFSLDDYNKIVTALKTVNYDWDTPGHAGAMSSEMASALEKAGVSWDLIGLLAENSEAMDSLASSLQENAAVTTANTTAMVQSANMGEDNYTESDYNTALTNLGQSYANYILDNPENFEGKGTDGLGEADSFHYFTTDTEENIKDVVKAYNDLMGATEDSLVQYAEENGKIVKQTRETIDDEFETDEDTGAVSIGQVASILNSTQAVDYFDNDQWEAIDKSLEESYNDFKSRIADSYVEKFGLESEAALTQSQRDEIEAAAKSAANSLVYNPEDISFATGKDGKLQANLGYGSYDYNQLNEAAANVLLEHEGDESQSEYGAYERARMASRRQTEWDNDEQDRLDLSNATTTLSMSTEDVEAFSEQLIRNNKLLQEHTDLADDVAQQMLQEQAGYNALTKAISDNSDTLKTADKKSVEYSNAIEDIREATNSWLECNFSYDEIVDNLEMIQKAAEGDTEALHDLQMLATQNFIVNLDVNQDTKDQLNTLLTDIDASLAAQDYEIGVTFDTTQATDALNQLMITGAATKDQINDYLSSIGWEPEIGYVTQEMMDSVSIASDGTATLTDPDGNVVTLTATQYEDAKTNGFAQIPYIKSKNSAYAGPKSGGASPSSSKSGGGGGGGSTKKKEKKKKDAGDRYHTVNEQLEDISNQLDALSSSEDQAFGAEKISVMTEELSKLNEEVDKYNDKLQEAKNYLVEDTNTLEDYAAKAGLTVEYGTNGEIANWDALKQGYLDWYNAAVDKYNAGSIDDDTFDEQYETIYDEAMDAFDQYEETNNLVQELNQNILDAMIEYEDKLLEIAQTKIELKIDLDDEAIDTLDYFLDKLDDDLYDSVDRLSLMEDSMATLLDESDGYVDNINELLGTAGEWTTDEDGNRAFNSYGLTIDDLADLMTKSGEELQNIFGGEGSDVSQLIEQLRDDYTSLLEVNTKILEQREEMIAEIGTTFEAWNDEIDESIDRIDANSELMEHYRNVIDIIGRKSLGITSQFIKDYNLKQVDNDLATLTTEYAQLNEMRATASQLEQAIMNETSEEAKEKMQDELDAITDAINEQTEQTAQAWEDCMRGIQETYEDSIQTILDDWQDKLAGLAGSADMLSLSFDMAADVDDDYLDDYDKIYELSKLTRDINNSIDDTDNLRSKQDLIDLMETVNELEESDADVSQYKVDSLRAQYELLLAQQQLEEAQNAKDTVRMTQDNEGNWGYVYTANQDEISEAEQEMSDKLQAYEELTQNYIDDLDEQISELSSSVSDKMEQISEDESLSYEEKMEKMNEVRDWAQTQLDYYYSEMEIVTADAQQLFEDDVNKYAELTNTKVLDDTKWKSSFEDTKTAQITGLTDLGNYYDNFSNTMTEAMDNCIDVTAEFAEKNAEAFALVGMSIENASAEMTADLDAIADGTERVKDATVEMAQDAGSTIGTTIDYMAQLGQQVNTLVDDIVSRNEDIVTSCQTTTQAIADQQASAAAAEAESAKASAAAEAAAKSSNSGGSGSSGSGSGSSGSNDSYTGGNNPDNTTSNLSPSDAITAKRTTALLKAVSLKSASASTSTKNASYQWLMDNGYLDTGGYTGAMQYADTGMYTGEWANGSTRANGKLAFLHQKELVLNAHDTENFLDAVDIVRNLNDTLDLNALSMSKGIGGLTAASLTNDTSQSLDQTVTISAEFPNVSDKNEIQEAFTNLINRASQFANRKK